MDIDLVDDHASIKWVGTIAAPFYGEYDGASFKISNWTYGSASDEYVGLFGYESGGFLKHIRLARKWEVPDYATNVGFSCGYLGSSAVYDVKGDFTENTIISGGPLDSHDVTGVLFRYIYASSVYGAMVRGNLDLEPANYTGVVGGIVGFMKQSLTLAMDRNFGCLSVRHDRVALGRSLWRLGQICFQSLCELDAGRHQKLGPRRWNMQGLLFHGTGSVRI